MQIEQTDHLEEEIKTMAKTVKDPNQCQDIIMETNITSKEINTHKKDGTKIRTSKEEEENEDVGTNSTANSESNAALDIMKKRKNSSSRDKTRGFNTNTLVIKSLTEPWNTAEMLNNIPHMDN